MKKKMVMVVLSALSLTAVLSGCGETKDTTAANTNVSESTSQSAEVQQDAQGNVAQQSESTQTVDTTNAGQGYIFVQDGITVAPDMDAAPVIEALGEDYTYFEAASCAFEGLDKMYTYAHFEIDTYPNADQDLISNIILKDDLVTTKEGAYIGMSASQITDMYGEAQETDGMLTYELSDMTLKFVLDADTVVSIEYASNVLDAQ